MESLVPHPVAIMPIDAEDSQGIHDSVRQNGVYHPLVVLAKLESSGKHQILDGVNRWEAAKAAGLATVTCNLVRTDDPESVVYASFATGRKRTTGSRVLAYLKVHWKEVKKAHDLNPIYRLKTCKKANVFPAGHGDRQENPYAQFWTAEAIADRLKCSDKDVLAGIELLLALESGKTVPYRGHEEAKDADQDYLEKLRQQRDMVLCGVTPIRRWKPSFLGSALTKQQGRLPTDYGECGLRGCKLLLTACSNWKQVSFDYRKEIIPIWHELMKKLPEDLR